MCKWYELTSARTHALSRITFSVDSSLEGSVLNGFVSGTLLAEALVEFEALSCFEELVDVTRPPRMPPNHELSGCRNSKLSDGLLVCESPRCDSDLRNLAGGFTHDIQPAGPTGEEEADSSRSESTVVASISVSMSMRIERGSLMADFISVQASFPGRKLFESID